MAVRVPRHVTVFYSQTVFTDLVSSMPAKESSLCFWALGDLSGCEQKHLQLRSFISCFSNVKGTPKKRNFQSQSDSCNWWMFPPRSPGTIRTVLGGYFGSLGRKDRFERSGCTGQGKQTSQQTVARCWNMFNESSMTIIAN